MWEGCPPPTGRGVGQGAVALHRFILIFGSKWVVFLQKICVRAKGGHRRVPPKYATGHDHLWIHGLYGGGLEVGCGKGRLSPSPIWGSETRKLFNAFLIFGIKRVSNVFNVLIPKFIEGQNVFLVCF